MRLARGARRGCCALLLASAGGAAPWQDADKVVDGLFDAQTELVLSDARRPRAGRRPRA